MKLTMDNKQDRHDPEERDGQNSWMSGLLSELGLKFRDRLADPLVQMQFEDDLHLAARALLESGASQKDASRLLSKYWEIGVRDADEFVRNAKRSNDVEDKIEAQADQKAKKKERKRLDDVKKRREEREK